MNFPCLRDRNVGHSRMVLPATVSMAPPCYPRMAWISGRTPQENFREASLDVAPLISDAKADMGGFCKARGSKCFRYGLL